MILRPHYQTGRLAPHLIAGLVARFGAHPNFRHVERVEESDSLLESDLLISDWSAMAIEYALGFGKPVLDRIGDAPRVVEELVAGAADFRERTVSLRKSWTFNFGHSVEAGAREIARIADAQAGVGSRGASAEAKRAQGMM